MFKTENERLLDWQEPKYKYYDEYYAKEKKEGIPWSIEVITTETKLNQFGEDQDTKSFAAGKVEGRAEATARIKELEQALEVDATDLWRVTNAIKKEIASREWIMEGRGCYAWDDNRYKDETRLAFEAVLKLIKDVQHPAQLRFHKVMDCNGKKKKNG